MFVILLLTGSRDADQISYNDTRLEDIYEISSPITSSKGIEYTDKIRIFSGDNPARQFESGQQRGGNYGCLCGVHASDHINMECCLRQQYMNLDDRCKLLTEGTLWKKFKDGEHEALKKLKKDDLQSELFKRGSYVEDKKAPELQEEFNALLHGICRPPALMLKTPHLPSSDLNLEFYEIMHCEPLHDISNFVQDIITELPNQIEDKTMQTDLQEFSATTVGDKNQIKGSDARMYAVKLAKFINQKFNEGKASKELLDLVNAIVEVISISYSKAESRTIKQVLRLYNQSFILAVLSQQIIGQPKKITSRKFYGSYFHGLTVHLPDTYRIISLSSTIPEQEERTFGMLRSISERTSNRQSKYVVDNAVLRWSCQENKGTKEDAFAKQNSSISRQAALLPKRKPTRFSFKFIKSRQGLFQAHCQRIADFLLVGENGWWYQDGDGIVFRDGPDDPDLYPGGPDLHHFRCCSLKSEQKYLSSKWSACIIATEEKKMMLPLTKIKVHDENGNAKIIKTNFSEGNFKLAINKSEIYR